MNEHFNHLPLVLIYGEPARYLLTRSDPRTGERWVEYLWQMGNKKWGRSIAREKECASVTRLTA